MPKFRIVNGEHSEWCAELNASVTYRAFREGDKDRNDVLESDRDLMKVFPNKFERYYEKEQDSIEVDQTKFIDPDINLANQQSRKAAEEAAKQGETDKTPSKAPAAPKSSDPTEFGSEVTTDFEDAVENGLRVFKKGNYFTVVEADDPTKAVSPEKLTKSKVAGWIAEYAGVDEDADEDEEEDED